MSEPKGDLLVRPIDETFIEILKEDMRKHPALCPQPVICLVENVNRSEDYKEGSTNVYATIGGNHRRRAMMDLIADGTFDENTTLSTLLVFGKSCL